MLVVGGAGGVGSIAMQLARKLTGLTVIATASRPQTRDWVLGLGAQLKPQQDLTLRITRANGQVENVPVRCRIDTPIEFDYYQHGGILPFVLRQLVAAA